MRSEQLHAMFLIALSFYADFDYDYGAQATTGPAPQLPGEWNVIWTFPNTSFWFVIYQGHLIIESIQII